ncbi:hypothetical protein AVEN_69724-1 [Araneus ventricosus]|uniref:Uncharacterized protein n=2 Tax=Araneus ventricosus TaxID=182803 RepID=A0A4Y2TUR5_ARAVE|nr:hypothetical protein AVEN_199616-1 [Araneus ventricosus]GBO02976.1 hypothetical protein AVEN_69724-1 [Araneus ventricosus]
MVVAVLFESLRPTCRALVGFGVNESVIGFCHRQVSVCAFVLGRKCFVVAHRLLVSRVRSIQRESIAIVKKLDLGILTNPHVLDLPESKKKTILELSVSVCEHDNSKTVIDGEMKFGM